MNRAGLPSAVQRIMKPQGRLIVVSGPSGCGKTTLCSRLLEKNRSLVRSISMTTRGIRRDERKNADYIYISKEQFQARLAKDMFLEHARVFGCYYGTPKQFIQQALKKKQDVLLNIDVQGAAQIKKKCPEAVLIFIVPPSMRALQNRLSSRSTDAAGQIKKRLAVARKELAAIGRYDFWVVNDALEKAVQELEYIIMASRHQIL
jgi:guanylate kinase